MPLSDTTIRKAKATGKPYKLFDGGGLYIEIPPTGNKRWRWKYRFMGKEKRLAFGTYPAVSLADAREQRQEARKLLASGVDPGVNRKAQKAARAERAANSFEAIAREWLTIKQKEWSEKHYKKQVERLENHAFPDIGKTPIMAIGVSDLRVIMNRIHKAGHSEQLHRVMGRVSNVFDYAIATERAERNPARDLRAAMPARRRGHFATITDPEAIGKLLRAMDGYTGHAVTCAALKLAPMTFVRPGELRQAFWDEFEFDHPTGPRWVIPPARRKLIKAVKEDPNTLPHIVPLAAQVVAILRELQALTGHRDHVLPGARSPRNCMSENTVNITPRTTAAQRRVTSPCRMPPIQRFLVFIIFFWGGGAIYLQVKWIR